MTDEPIYEKPVILPTVDEAFEKIFEVNSEMSLEHRFDVLLQSIIESSIYLLDRQRRTGKAVGDADREFQYEAEAQLKLIEKCFVMAKKYGRLSSSANPEFETEIITHIRTRQSSIGDIVRIVPTSNKKNE